jgi:hypothetical protein
MLYSLTFVAIAGVALALTPKRWAPLPLIMAASYLTIGQSIDLGSFTFTGIRVMIAIGILRVLLRGERVQGGLNRLDWAVIAWSAWMVASGLFHTEGTLITRLGFVFSSTGVYFLLRVFCGSLEEVRQLCYATAILLLPVAVEMVYEMRGSSSLFYLLEGNPVPLYLREDRIRAYGPFAHPILAGTVGAVSLPLMLAVWRQRRTAACIGILACVAMIISSASSGPVVSSLMAVVGLAAWFCRQHMRAIRLGAVASYLTLSLVMQAPVYYLIARLDIIGGSTSYHRAALIDASLTHLHEWWLVGTGYTRHWIRYADGFSPDHTDITNHYIYMGILGGLPLLLLFGLCLVQGFSMVGERLRDAAVEAQGGQFMVWALGASLFAHATTFLSVSYFDQSQLFFYLTLASIGSARALPASAAPERAVAIVSHGRPAFGLRPPASPFRAARQGSPRQSRLHIRSAPRVVRDPRT